MTDFSIGGDRIWCSGFRISANKSFEIQAGRFREGNIFEVSLEWTRRQDHAGIGLHIEVWGFHLIAKFYDNRHWDDEKGKWYDRAEEKAG